MSKKLLIIGTLLVAAAFVIAGCGTDSGSTDTIDDPEKLYLQRCSQCHGENLEGNSNINAPALKKIGGSLSKEDIEHIIINGQGAMRPVSLEEEATALVAEWLATKK